MHRWTTRICALAAPLLLSLSAQAQLDLKQLDRDMAGTRAQVMVLGTIHLRGMPKSFDPAALDGVLQKLAAFKPEIITIEQQSGEECLFLRALPEKYGTGFNCADTAAGQAATGLDLAAALTEANQLFAQWPAQPTPAQRRHLAAVLLAAADPNSAYVQWLQLPASERHVGDGLDAKLVEALETMNSQRDESTQVAARLAARLGLQRVHAVDNHTGDNMQVDDKVFWPAVQAAWAAHPGELKAKQRQKDLLQARPDLLALYRFINDPGNMGTDGWSGVAPSMLDRSRERYAQMWVGGWEVRNLRMVANIRETFRERPGARVLVIVGSAHKPWFDHWLGDMQGVDVVDAVQVLK